MNNYQNQVEGFMNPKTIQTFDTRIMNAMLGLSGEIGETQEHIKKWAYHDKPLDREKVKLELGDVYFYLAEACSALDTTLEEIAMLNVQKLLKRYPDGKFSTEYSIAKQDEAQPAICTPTSETID